MSTTFDAFWAEVDAELAQLPMAPELEVLPERSTESSTTYWVRLTSIGPYRIGGFFSVPNASGQVPGLLTTPRYGSVNNPPDFHDRARYAVLQIMHRGQRLADKPFAAAYPGLLTHGIESQDRYIYRGIVADCLRAAEFLRSRPEVESARIGVQGDDLALLTAARRPIFSTVMASELMLYRLLEASARTEAYPLEEVNEFLRTNPSQRASVTETLTYFDPLGHAPSIRAHTMLPRGDDETWLRPLRDALGGPQAEYHLTHKGQVDRDWLDTWFSGQLGSQPRSRFLQEV
jgi:cephalosporin-C deacetylase-like acetyl esterase